MTINIDIKEIKHYDLDGNIVVVNDFAKTIGNGLYFSVPTIDLLKVCEDIHAERVVEVNQTELRILLEIAKKKTMATAFAQLPLVKYLEEKLECLKKDTK